MKVKSAFICGCDSVELVQNISEKENVNGLKGNKRVLFWRKQIILKGALLITSFIYANWWDFIGVINHRDG